MTRHFDPPYEGDVAGTVFDPTSDTFGPIMAAIKRGDFEQAADALRAIDPEPDHFEGNIGANIAGGRHSASLPAHVLEAAHELADAAINPNGYADDGDEADRRAAIRDALESRLVGVVLDTVRSVLVAPPSHGDVASTAIPEPCRYFAYCERETTRVVDHPILGAVPCCERCATVAGVETRPRTTDEPSPERECRMCGWTLGTNAASCGECASHAEAAPSHGEPASTAICFYEAENGDDPSLPERASCRGGSGPFLLPIEDADYGGVIAWANTPEQAERIVRALRGSQRRAAEWYDPADFPPGASA